MIREGHSDVMRYGYSFYGTCVEELGEGTKEGMLNAAFAVRVASSKPDDWKKFVKETTPKDPIPKKRVNDHAANIAAARRIGRVHG